MIPQNMLTRVKFDPFDYYRFWSRDGWKSQSMIDRMLNGKRYKPEKRISKRLKRKWKVKSLIEWNEIKLMMNGKEIKGMQPLIYLK